MPSLLLSLLLATAGIDAGVVRPVDAGTGPSADASVAQLGDAGVAQAAPAGGGPPVYVLGSSLNLRKEPSSQAEVVEKLPIGTECRASGPTQGEWRKVCCGGKPGFVSASLVGPEKPSADQHRAEAQDAKRSLEQRLESALRAATLAPEDARLRELLGELFYQRQLELAAAEKKPRQKRTFTKRCHLTDEATCLKQVAGHLMKGVGTGAMLTKDLFVLAIGNLERVVVYRGRYSTRKYPALPETFTLTYDVLAEERFTPTPVLQEALFTVCGKNNPCYVPPGAASPGQFALDDASQLLLRGIPQQWARMEVDPKAEGNFEGPWFEMLWNCPEKQPLLLDFEPDLHGRWRLGIPLKGTAWISAVEKVEGDLLLTLLSETEDVHGKRTTATEQLLFKTPQQGGDVAYLGDVPYTADLRRYPKKNHYPCR